jgi:HEAT repeat protein
MLAVELCARAATPQSTAAVVGALEDPDAQVRRTAVAAMSMLRTPAAVDALARSLSDPQAEIRLAAVQALSLIDDEGVPDVMISALNDPEVRVRDLAGEALTRWRSPAVARRLAAALDAPDLRRSVAAVLERMGQAAVGPLVEVVVDRDDEVAAQAGSLLERIAGAEPFVAGLLSIDPGERLRAVEVLGAIGGPDAAAALLSALADPDARVRARGATHLGRLGDPRAAAALKRVVLTDPVADVVAAAQRALGGLDTGLPGDPETARTDTDSGPEDVPTS